MKLTAEVLAEACGDLAGDAGLTITAELEPLAGPGAPVKPATYEGGRYQIDKRWWDGGDEGEREPVDVIVIDNEPSEANRLEAALEVLCPELGLPELVLDLSSVGALPPHLPERISGFRFPHRNADAYLRDALLDGAKFPATPTGQAIFGATADRSLPLLEWFPQALLYGFWQSHLGKRRSQAKLARSWFSEIVGYVPAATDTKRLGLKGDPLNLTDTELEFDENDQLGDGWVFKGTSKARGRNAGKTKDALSNIGHGQVPVGEGLAGVSFAAVTQRSTVSLAALRRVRTGEAGADPAARALLVALGLVAHAAAFCRSFSLRSGCELRPRKTTWKWLGGAEDGEIEVPTTAETVELFRRCVEQAEEAGLPVGSRWADEPLLLEPNESLAKAIRASWPLED